MNVFLIVETAVYGLVGLLLMAAGYVFFDKVTPFNFTDEIEEKNPAVGAMIGGIFIAVGIIVTAVIR